MTRQQAQARMDRAKALYTRAARAVLDGWPMAEAMTRAALAELNAAREALKTATDAASELGPG